MRKFIISHKKLTLFLCIVVLVFILVFIWWQNNALVVTRYMYESKKIPDGLNGLCIVQLSDLHNKDYGNKLFTAIQNQQPDLIVITGDLIDNRSKNIGSTINLLEELLLLAPIYYVSGNNEEWSNRYEELAARLTASGVIVLDDKAVKIERNNSSFNLIGIVDPEFIKGAAGYVGECQAALIRRAIQQNIVTDEAKLNVLLAHRPELLSLYAEYNVDLVFSGHAHGGQVRIPFVGGLIAPNQGLFPKYTEGLHTQRDTTMVVSRGLGNSIIPLRLFNRPELVVVTLKRQ
jgi:predicted MPP superfamily phosphohydrolase